MVTVEQVRGIGVVQGRAWVGRLATVSGVVVVLALALAACGTSSTSTPAASGATTTTLPLTAADCPSLAAATAPPGGTVGGSTTTTVARHPIFCRKGSKSGIITGVKTPKVPKWTLAWHFDCTRVKGGKGSFAIVLHPPGNKPAIKVTSQKGLGGGGSNFYAPGDYSLSVSTACSWTVTGYV
jgi:hypothetical protein